MNKQRLELGYLQAQAWPNSYPVYGGVNEV